MTTNLGSNLESYSQRQCSKVMDVDHNLMELGSTRNASHVMESGNANPLSFEVELSMLPVCQKSKNTTLVNLESSDIEEYHMSTDKSSKSTKNLFEPSTTSNLHLNADIAENTLINICDPSAYTSQDDKQPILVNLEQQSANFEDHIHAVESSKETTNSAEQHVYRALPAIVRPGETQDPFDQQFDNFVNQIEDQGQYLYNAPTENPVETLDNVYPKYDHNYNQFNAPSSIPDSLPNLGETSQSLDQTFYQNVRHTTSLNHRQKSKSGDQTPSLLSAEKYTETSKKNGMNTRLPPAAHLAPVKENLQPDIYRKNTTSATEYTDR